MRYRKKPIVVEAFQWPSDSPPSWWTRALEMESSYAIGNAREHGARFGGTGETHALIKTFEGVMRVDEGDWIIRGIKNELYPCKPDIFRITYEEYNE